MDKMEIELSAFAIKAGAAILAGFCMGFERQLKGKHAGLKTNTLVALGSTIFVTIALLFKDSDKTDMTRIIGQVVVGVGFLGAGVIMQRKEEEEVKGLATAATIWCSAAAGCLAALELYQPLFIFTALVVIINLTLGYLNKKMSENSNN